MEEKQKMSLSICIATVPIGKKKNSNFISQF